MLYIFVLSLSFILTYLIKKYAIKKSLFAQINERSLHSIPTPYGGGIAIAISWFLGLFYLYITSQIDKTLFFTLLLGLFLSIVSFIDDLYTLSPKIRLIAQSIVSILALILLGGLKKIDLFIFEIDNSIFNNIFAFLLIVWFINLYNFLDGIDGYAGSEAVFLGISGFVIFGGEHFLVLVASVLGFLVWNWHRAKIFMGDVGSTLLGYNIAIFTIYYSNINFINFWIWILLFTLFWFDATFTLIRRFKNGEKLSQAHKEHIYQKLTQRGYTHSRVVIFSIFINMILFILSYYLFSPYIK